MGGDVYVRLSENYDFMSGCFSVLSENVEDTHEFKDGQTKQKAKGRRTQWQTMVNIIIHNRVGQQFT